MEEEHDFPKGTGKKVLLASILILILIFAWFVFFNPLLKPWRAKQSGKAELAQAEQNRQIAILEATAKKDSFIQLAEAEVIRAEGIAKANKIIAGSITEEYLKYRFIEGLNDGNTEVIYVPTEANLPILEARDKTNEN